MSDNDGNGHRNGYSTLTWAAGQAPGELPSAWLTFIRYCQTLGHGEIASLKIQDGVPVMAEVTVKKIKFS